MGTKIDFGSLFIMTDDGPVKIIDEIEDFSESISAEVDDKQASKSLRSWQEPVTFTMDIRCRPYRRRAVGMKWPFNHTNNWLKMHGYPQVKSVPLRKRRTRSKKKNVV